MGFDADQNGLRPVNLLKCFQPVIVQNATEVHLVHGGGVIQVRLQFVERIAQPQDPAVILFTSRRPAFVERR